jgi:Glycosyl hydrolase family 99
MRRLAVALIAAAPAAVALPSAAGAAADPTPVYAYYYIWFNPSSWKRAKIDLPQLGTYSSDEQTVMRQHIRLAKRAGVNGFIVSWKSTPTLDERLAKLISVAERERFKLMVIYQGLDFERRPLPVAKVSADLDFFQREFAGSPVFDGFGKPVVVWSGTWEFSPAQIARVTDAHRDRLTVLATERNPYDYAAKDRLFDGNAYYWGAVNPDTYPKYDEKLRKMGVAAHANGGMWIAPAAPGFDARLVGGRTVVKRKGGDTLRRQLDAAQQSSPDVIGLISWNEFSENTHVEPSENHGGTALEVLADVRGSAFEYKGEFDSSAPQGRQSGAIGSIGRLVAFVAVLAGVLLLMRWRRRRRPGWRPDPA